MTIDHSTRDVLLLAYNYLDSVEGADWLTTAISTELVRLGVVKNVDEIDQVAVTARNNFAKQHPEARAAAPRQ